MNYTVSFIIISERQDPFDYVTDGAYRCYQQLQRESLTTAGGVLPVTTPSDWSCPIVYEDTNEHVYSSTLFSTLGLDEFRRLLEARLVPVFADRIEVVAAKPSERSVVQSN